MCKDNFEKDEWVDYPYLGIGEKPMNNHHKYPSEEQLEKLAGG